MDISKPPLDYLSDLDEQIARLEQETRVLKDKFGFEGVSEAETLLALRKKQKDASRLKSYQEEGNLF
jgi:hypothetical protein